MLFAFGNNGEKSRGQDFASQDLRQIYHPREEGIKWVLYSNFEFSCAYYSGSSGYLMGNRIKL